MEIMELCYWSVVSWHRKSPKTGTRGGRQTSTKHHQLQTARRLLVFECCCVQEKPESIAIMAPPTPSSHRPRRKRKDAAFHSGSNDTLIVDTGNGKSQPAFPLVSFLWAARAGVSPWLIIPLILMVVGLFRWAVGLWGYSGTRPSFERVNW